VYDAEFENAVFISHSLFSSSRFVSMGADWDAVECSRPVVFSLRALGMGIHLVFT